MKFEELKNKSDQELQKLLSELRIHVRELKFKVSADQLKNIRELRTAKKNVAQILLLLNRKHQLPVVSVKETKPEVNKEAN